MVKLRSIMLGLVILTVLLAGCGEKGHYPAEGKKMAKQPQTITNKPAAAAPVKKTLNTAESDNGIKLVQSPDSIPVLVNKVNKLPDDYNPSDLVFPDIPFAVDKKSSKRQMRQEAAKAIEKLFAAAEQDGLPLLGVSAYRSFDEQKRLFNYYVNQDGLEAAQKYSALPGTSEHETGLAIDVTGGNGKCAATDCFKDTPEAKWLDDHVAEYGFIIRYPKGKEAITGYQYEPWHLRYVGTDIAGKIKKRGITLEEYYNSIQVNN